MSSIPKVPVGPTTVIGTGVSTLAFSGAVAAFLAGDRSEQTIGVIVGGAVGAVILIVTLLGRFAQARLLIDRMPYMDAPSTADEVEPQTTVRLTPPSTSTSQTSGTWIDGPHLARSRETELGPAGARLADPLLDDPEGDDEEPSITDEELEGRDRGNEAVGHGTADMRDDHDREAVR